MATRLARTARAFGQRRNSGHTNRGSRCRGRGRRQVLEREGEIVRGLETQVGGLLEAAADGAVEAWQNGQLREIEVRRLPRQDRRHGVRGRLAAERALARQHLVEHGAEREHVAAMVHGQTADLFRRHVPERAEHRARRRVRQLRREQRAIRTRSRRFRQAKVENLHVVIARDHHVLGLQIPMHDAARVSRAEALGDLQRVRDRFARRNRAALEARAQRLAVNQLHDDERGAGVVAEFEDGEDVRMRELRDAYGLALEARHRRFILWSASQRGL